MLQKRYNIYKKRLKPKSSFIKEQFMMDGERERERERERENISLDVVCFN